MSDILTLNSGVDNDSLTGSTSSLNTGTLRRKYNFGDYVSELSIMQDPFFRFVSMVSKKPTDDPSFKFTEKRHSYHRRYAYVTAHDNATGTASVATTTDINAASDAVGDNIKLKMETDYLYEGNQVKSYGQTATAVGATGTRPRFFFANQLVKIPLCAASNGSNNQDTTEYIIVKVNQATDSGEAVILDCKVVKAPSAVDQYFMGAPNAAQLKGSQEGLAPYRCYVSGSAHAEGSGYPETWIDQPYVTGTGQTQIFKTSAVMNNTDRATVLKYEGNEWARIWKEKLIEHKWDIEQALLFGSQQSNANVGVNTTEGAVSFISDYGNLFDMTLATKTQDSFLDDLSAMLDPRYNNASSTVFFCSTAVYNWLHKLSGYFANNIGAVQPFAGGTPNTAAGQADSHTAARADMALTGRKKVFGVDITTISTIYGDMNVARNIHLDGTKVKMLGVNMKYCAYRPLVGNGINRDTGVYVGVQTLENSGVDRRVDQILTEAGMEWCCPETHAIWQ